MTSISKPTNFSYIAYQDRLTAEFSCEHDSVFVHENEELCLVRDFIRQYTILTNIEKRTLNIRYAGIKGFVSVVACCPVDLKDGITYYIGKNQNILDILAAIHTKNEDIFPDNKYFIGIIHKEINIVKWHVILR